MKDKAILIVDDVEINRTILKKVFENEYEILEASNGKEALVLLGKHYQRLAVILMDIIMPEMDGFQFLEILKERNLNTLIPVMLMTGEESQDLEKQGFERGSADFIRKPFQTDVIRHRVKNIVRLYEYEKQLKQQVQIQSHTIMEQQARLQEMNRALIDTMSNVVEFRNMESGQHVKRIKRFSRVLIDEYIRSNPGCGLTAEDAEMIEMTSALHDVGKIYIPDNILLKPGRLTPEEFEVIKSHTIYSGEIIEQSITFTEEKYAKCAYNIARHHHEKYNGGGYPDGLMGDEIPLEAQIVSVADVFDALVSSRIYKEAYDVETAYRMIINGECGEFSKQMLTCFINVKEQFTLLANTLTEKTIAE